MDKQVIEIIISRLEKLERAVFTKKAVTKSSKDVKEIKGNFKGATGGIRLLVSEGYFNRKRSFKEVREGLSVKEYHYSPQAAQSALNNLCKKDKVLVAVEEKGVKMYAKRK